MLYYPIRFVNSQNRNIRTRVVNPVDQITKEAYRFAHENKKAENPLAGNVGSM